jgi:thiosulfate dehydrogenase
MVAVAMTAFVLSIPASAEETISSIARGGRLYDKWFKVVGAKTPKTAHPSYPKTGKYRGRKGADWRCKECHGWDYRGKNGAYSKGKHFTGIKGITGMAGAAPAKIIAILKDKTHGYNDDMMSAQDFRDLALFVSKGQFDMDKYIARAKKAPKGDKAKGAAYFNTICVGCHRKDGSRPKDMSKPLGAQMGNPWEVMHKILNGNPGEKMPALRALDWQIVADIMAHLKTLPKKK